MYDIDGKDNYAYLIILWNDASGRTEPDTAKVFGIYYSKIKAEKEFKRIAEESVAVDRYKSGEMLDLQAIPISILDDDPIVEDGVGKPASERLYEYLSETVWPSLVRKMSYDFRDDRHA